MPLVNLSELIEMAVKDEETGIAFYRALAERAKDADVRRQVLAIAQQEEVQLAWFRKMLNEVGQYQPTEQYPGEYEEYLWALLKSRAFPEPEAAAAKARAVAGDAEGIDVAIRLEKDTLLFLHEMRRFLGDERSAYVDVIIDEEQDHLVDLAKLKGMVS
jgi:rubrerythrin